MTLSMRGTAKACALVTLVAIGCYGSKPPSGKPTTATTTQSNDPAVQATDMAHDTDDHAAGPALSEEDQALAALQKLCPVSGEELGGMGTPVKLTVKGEPVFICCKGCEKKVNADPDKYLAKVADLKKANP
jgi:hypothetical protein